jgi:hypothetical protein
MQCPLCKSRVAISDTPTEAEFYAHINNPRECSDQFPVCPVCDMSFASYVGSRPWRRFARHWCRYVGLTDQEHIIMSAMGEE